MYSSELIISFNNRIKNLSKNLIITNINYDYEIEFSQLNIVCFIFMINIKLIVWYQISFLLKRISFYLKN